MRETENGPHDLEVIAGHCSFNPERIDELHEISEIMVKNKGKKQKAISAVRFVGLKSRTEHNTAGEGMGIDFEVIEQAIITNNLPEIPPSVVEAQKFVQETGMAIAAEIMLPSIQLPAYENSIPSGKLVPWNPSTDQLGWHVRQIAEFASRNDWLVGIKNGKWLGQDLGDFQKSNINTTSMEKAWLGLATYAKAAGCDIAFIHRGVDVPGKGQFRNAPIHNIVRNLAKKIPEAGRFFDPSHIFGPLMQNQIVEKTIQAMKMMVGNEFLYTGILIESGTSITDTNQHISVDELRILIKEISKFRKLGGPFITST